MEMSAMGGVCLPEEPHWDGSVEIIAAELQTPLDLLQLSAEGLAQHLRESEGDPVEISAAEALVHSAERMRRIVQALIDSIHEELP
jgi:nitrogen fixation/metabolism regulation signal transduction histidine kinase